MIELSVKDIAQITGGYLDCVADPSATVTASVEFDSREVRPGGLFVAFPGARVDGHDFAAQAVAAGAVAVLAARPVGIPAIVVEPTGRPTGAEANADIYAHDVDGSAAAVVRALSALAQAVVERLPQLNVVGVTGSAGKTSTKDLIATALRADGPTVAPPGSFNNEIGHPYTALRCTQDTRHLVAELSARGVGHIAHLARIAPPRVGVVLNVGSAHLGEFGSRANIAQAKGELVEALPANGTAVLNADDALVAAMAARTPAQVVTFGVDNQEADYRATDIELDDVARPTFVLHAPGLAPTRVRLRVFGRHQVSNALAAVAAARASGMELADIVAALEGHTNASAHRMDVRTRADGVTIIDDAYNANPDSMAAAIAALGYTTASRPDARSIAVLGEMGELGEDAPAAHAALAHELSKFDVDHLVVVGESPNCVALANAARTQGVATIVAGDSAAATEHVRELLRQAPAGVADWASREAKDVVLTKASNVQQLWRVAEALVADGPARG
ncbi:UDP-N-acetylmuramoyl-tripeptide--D-alanyl-D-alanine ligase [Corynebacterium lizhenjunii]|uniref:UDP-N-acetylmuramoyl-tripeptide--D-alanyl-D-alanine ligase n=1 Tax=Corynebacterium lizhenjunii TaxID=2709394 RepID=A0A7T0PB96_9CORY|nr:UDP-N-acetylmuramoyl-tripeptide--D-alanyl-D-alanine ligase [Corynebacterium lizhenjunii]QPK78507.1 UDP-N-acetylmuramoyl-tripeptide--D-alanyl-D-alanine ligase [Corynebacterium lizhenjunii]